MNIKYIKTTDNKKYDLRDKRITDTDTGIATQSANGLLSSGDKKKLDGIASGAEVNQNAFSNIKIGNTTIVADGKTDTVELTAGNNITLTPDATNDKITIAATDTNTTYTFKGGTNQFTVTPSNGTAQTVSVTPSIANNVTGSDLTANTIILGNGNSGVKKSGKTIVTTLGSDDTTLPTSKAVKAAIDALPEPMIFKGTLGTNGTITSLPAAAASNEGYTYKVITDGTYAQQSAKIGDVFISNGSSWNLIPSGDEPSGTVTNIATGTGLTGGPITSSGTISHADTSSQESVSNSGRTYIQSITLDGMGHVTGISSATETVTNTDTKVTQRIYTGDGIMPLLFATEQCGYPGNITNIVYRNDAIYALPSQGWIFANRFMGSFEGTLYGSAYEAHKLENTTSVGSETQPVYFKQGVPTACSYTLNKTAPSSSSDDTTVPTSKAVWTAVSNGIAAADAMIYRGTFAGGSTGEYGALTPFANNGWTYKVTTAGKIDGKAVEIGDMLICNTDGTSAATSSNYSTIAANWDVIQANIDGAVTGPSQSTNAHVAVFDGSTGKVIKDSGYTIGTSVPSNAAFTDTDMKVRQSLTSSNLNRPLLMSYQQNTATSTVDNVVFRNNSIYANPSTGTITANKFNGNASSASKLTTNAGSATQPVYFSEGVPTAISYTINKSVPSNAVFTDTHYTTHLYAGSGTAANAETTNGNTKLTVVDNTTTRNSVTIKGTGGATVTSDANGVVTINSVNKTSKWFNFYSPSKVDNAYYFIISPIGGSAVTPSGTCYSIEINAVVLSSPGNYIISNTKFVIWCYWYASNAGLRITYPVYSNSKIPIYYHNKAEGGGIGNETRSSNVCNIPIKVENVESLVAVNIKVDGPGVSDCICTRSYSSFNWGQDEPTSWSAI